MLLSMLLPIKDFFKVFFFFIEVFEGISTQLSAPYQSKFEYLREFFALDFI